MQRPTSRYHARRHRHNRIRATISGTAARPRLAVYRSLNQISAQLIDDVAGRTLVSATEADVKKTTGTKTVRAAAV